jgi:hypothetical protein
MTHTHPTPDHRISTAVKRKTGRSSEQWNTILNRLDWKRKGATGVIQHLRRRYKLSDWAARVITLRYQMEKRVRQ